MMHRRVVLPYLPLLALLLAPAIHAAIFIAPKDTAIIDSADLIVIGRITQMNGEFVANGDIVTVIDIEVESVLKGSVPASKRIRIAEPGGVVGSAAMGVSAAPRYWRRNRALIFIEHTPDGMRTWGSMLGKFDFVSDRFERDLLVRWATEEDMTLWSNDGHPVDNVLRDAQEFLEFIRARVQQQQQHSPATGRRRAASAPPAPNAREALEEDACSYCLPMVPLDELTPPEYWMVEPDAHGYPASAYSQGSYRWETFDQGGSVTFFASGRQPGYDDLGAAQRSLAAWTNDPSSNIDYRYGGTRSLGFVNDGTNAIVFNSSTEVPSGAVAYAKWYGGAYHTYKGEQFISIFEGDVVVRSGLNLSQKVFEEAVTHELGHTLGFRHSDQGTPYSTQAVMKSVLSGVYGATLGPWDTEATHAVYGTTVTTPPAPGPPSNLVATAISTSSVRITWNPAANATTYELERSSNNGPFTTIASITGTVFTDTGRAANTTYLYRVRALSSAGTASAYSNVDHATTILFIDDPLLSGTVVKDEHITQLRTAINALRIAVGLGAFGFTQPVGPGQIIRAAHIAELRNALTPALSARGIAPSYTLLGTGLAIRTIHIQELRNYVK